MKQEGRVNVEGGAIWYEVFGAEKEGVPLVVIHGGPGAPHDYLEGLSALADERPVLFYDQLGCGKSDRPEARSLWTRERAVEELETLVDAMGLVEFDLLGQSWGAMLALSFLLAQEKRRVRKIVLSGPLISSPLWILDQSILLAELPEPHRSAALEAEASGDFSAPSYQEAMMAYYRKHLCRLEPWPEELERTMANMGSEVYLTMWGPSEFTCTGNLRDQDLSARLPSIDIPTLFTCGEFDEARPATVAGFAKLVPGSRMAMFEGTSHSHHLEAPERYIATLREFLD